MSRSTTIHDIAVHQGRDPGSPARLEVAVLLAKHHDAKVTGVFPKPDASFLARIGNALAEQYREPWNSSLAAGVAAAKETFERRVSEAGLSGAWAVVDANPTEAMTIASRYADLTVIGQIEPNAPAHGAIMPDAVILGAGGPVLVVPYVGASGTLGRHILVAWNGSREAARAVNDAMPMLERADTVTVWCAGSVADCASAGAVCARMARRGIAARSSAVPLGSKSRAVADSVTAIGDFGFQEYGPWTRSRHSVVDDISVGDALLSAIADESIDLLIMGAYGHARVREVILGGTTRHVLETMTVPVLMSH